MDVDPALVPVLNADRLADPTATRFTEEGAYAQALRGLHTWMLDWAFAPGAGDVARRTLAAALDHAGAADPALPVQVWVRDPSDAHDRLAAGIGLTVRRDLFQLRVPLPLSEPTPALDWRPFRPGVDEAAWLEVNNRAFAWHPEQGGWALEQLLEEEDQPWFDPAGFVMHWLDGRLAGFCWTKVHPADPPEPAMGEIYVIATDPDLAGRGLGQALTMTGLDWLHRVAGLDVGMLHVDADNTPAVRLYQRLGFSRHHVDRAYGRAAPRR